MNKWKVIAIIFVILFIFSLVLNILIYSASLYGAETIDELSCQKDCLIMGYGLSQNDFSENIKCYCSEPSYLIEDLPKSLIYSYDGNISYWDSDIEDWRYID